MTQHCLLVGPAQYPGLYRPQGSDVYWHRPFIPQQGESSPIKTNKRLVIRYTNFMNVLNSLYMQCLINPP